MSAPITLIGNVNVGSRHGGLRCQWAAARHGGSSCPTATLRVGGAVGNAALALRGLGLHCRLVAGRGDDVFGRWLAEAFGEGCRRLGQCGLAAAPTTIFRRHHPSRRRAHLLHHQPAILPTSHFASVLAQLSLQAEPGAVALLLGPFILPRPARRLRRAHRRASRPWALPLRSIPAGPRRRLDPGAARAGRGLAVGLRPSAAQRDRDLRPRRCWTMSKQPPKRFLLPCRRGRRWSSSAGPHGAMARQGSERVSAAASRGSTVIDTNRGRRHLRLPPISPALPPAAASPQRCRRASTAPAWPLCRPARGAIGCVASEDDRARHRIRNEAPIAARYFFIVSTGQLARSSASSVSHELCDV